MRPTILLPIVLTLTSAITAQADKKTEHESSTGPVVIVYGESGAFMTEGPKGWIADHETGQQLGVCCVFYREGSTFDDAETIIYPNIATKGPGQATLKAFMEHDLSDFREHNPGMTYEDAENFPLKNKRVAKLRYFHGVNKGSSEAIAYIDEEKIVALIVVSSKTEKGLNEAMTLLRDMLQSYSYMDVKFATSAAPK